MNAWNVYRPCENLRGGCHNRNRVSIDGELCTEINTVFYTDDCDEDYVRRSLIDHDGYPYDIIVRIAE